MYYKVKPTKTNLKKYFHLHKPNDTYCICARAMPRAKKVTRRTQFLKKTTGLCPSRSYYSMPSQGSHCKRFVKCINVQRRMVNFSLLTWSLRTRSRTHHWSAWVVRGVAKQTKIQHFSPVLPKQLLYAANDITEHTKIQYFSPTLSQR